jgi:hypothetical protein
MEKANKHPVSLWVIAFFTTAALQIFRGAAGDTIIFVSGTALLLSSGTFGRNLDFPAAKYSKTKPMLWAVLALVIMLTATPRHTSIMFGFFLALIVPVLLLAWGDHTEFKQKASPRIRRARLMWILWAVTMCLWEYAANVLGQLTNVKNAYPTISVLVDPLLDGPIGKAGFVLAWLAVGYGLIKVSPKK